MGLGGHIPACPPFWARYGLGNHDAWLYGDAKIPPFVYQFYPYPNYPRIPGVQVDLFWNGSESEGCLDCGDAPFGEVTTAGTR